MSNLGTAKFKDFPGFLDWYTALPLKDATTLLQECLPLVDVRNPIRNALDNTLSPNWGLEDSEKLWVSRKRASAGSAQTWYPSARDSTSLSVSKSGTPGGSPTSTPAIRRMAS